MAKDFIKRLGQRFNAVFLILYGFFLISIMGGHLATADLARELLNPGVWMIVAVSFVTVYVGLRLYVEDRKGGNGEQT